MNTEFHFSTSSKTAPEDYQLRSSAKRQATQTVPQNENLDAARRLLQQGHIDSAELHCFWQMEQFGPSGDVLHILGTIAIRRGHIPRALKRMENAVRFAPSNAVIRAHYAETLRHAGEVEKAVSEGREAVSLDPENAETHNCLGLAFLENKQLDLAIRAFENATKLAPANAGYWNNLGSTFRTLELIPQAITAYRKAVSLAPGSASFHSNLAGALVEDCQHHEGLKHFLEAAELDSKDAETLNHIGQIHDELGDSQAALGWFRKAIALDPNAVPAYVNLAVHHEKEITDADRAAIERILTTEQLTGKQEAALRFAKAHLLDKQKDYAGATREFRRANLVQKQWHESRREGYSCERHEKLVDAIINHFTADFFQRTAGWGSDSERPVFIIGLPRSGTTLTEQILAAHPDAFGAGELRIAATTFDSLPRRMDRNSHPTDCLQSLPKQLTGVIADDYLWELNRFNSNKSRVVDKMPENYMYVGWLSLLFPKARFIYCARDPRDIALSCLITSFRAVKWSNDDQFLIHRFQQHRRLMNHWNTICPGKIMEVAYEDTVQDRESQARRMLDWIGLPWNDACLDHTQAETIVRTASVSQARQPMYKSSVARSEKYRDYLSSLFLKLDQLNQRG